MQAFSNRLKTLRKSAGLTMKQVAARLEVSEAYVSMLESGKRQPARALVLQLAESLGAGSDSPLRDELLILAGFSPENLARFEAHDPLSGYQQALHASPEDFSLFQGYVQTLIKTGREAEALTQIEQGFRRFSNAYQLQCLIADLELARGCYEPARLAQQAALAQFRLAGLDAPQLEALLIANLGGICFQLGMQDLGKNEAADTARSCFLQAEAHFATALALDPDNLFSRDEYARVCFNLADLESGAPAHDWWRRSRDAFEQVMATDPKPGLPEAALRESAAFWAYATARCGEHEQARRQLWLMASLSPADWLPRYLLSSVELHAYASSGDRACLAAAAASFRRSLAINPEATRRNGRADPHLAPLRELHPELFHSDSPPDSPAKEQ